MDIQVQIIAYQVEKNMNDTKLCLNYIFTAFLLCPYGVYNVNV